MKGNVYNKDCCFYTEWQDMHAHIPYCNYAKEINNAPDYMALAHCIENCPYYYSKKKALDLVRKEVCKNN